MRYCDCNKSMSECVRHLRANVTSLHANIEPMYVQNCECNKFACKCLRCLRANVTSNTMRKASACKRNKSVCDGARRGANHVTICGVTPRQVTGHDAASRDVKPFHVTLRDATRRGGRRMA